MPKARKISSGLEPTPAPRGVRCPSCNCADTQVYRTTRAVSRVVRQRVCRHCRRRWQTTEK